jgi:hypothetical protein
MEAKRLSKSDSEHFQLSLRVRHPSMDPVDLSRAFKIEAEHSFRAGGSRPSSSSGAPASVHAESYWLGVLKPIGPLVDISFPEDRQSQIAQRQLAATTKSLNWALNLRTSRFLHTHADFLRRIRSEGGNVAFLVTIYTGEASTFTLAPEVSQILGNLGIAVEFELESK